VRVSFTRFGRIFGKLAVTFEVRMRPTLIHRNSAADALARSTPFPKTEAVDALAGRPLAIRLIDARAPPQEGFLMPFDDQRATRATANCADFLDQRRRVAPQRRPAAARNSAAGLTTKKFHRAREILTIADTILGTNRYLGLHHIDWCVAATR
jgi:hypothetical protein